MGGLPGLAAITRRTLWECFAEFTGTMLFLLVSLGTVMGTATGWVYTQQKTQPGWGVYDAGQLLAIALTFGVTIAALMWAVWPISGGQMNPAITFSLMVVGRTDFLRGLLLIISQILGGLLGVALLRALIPSSAHGHLAANIISPHIRPGAAFILEALGTALLVYVVCAVAVDKRGNNPAGRAPVIAPLAVGLTVFVANIFLIPFTSCGINPIRSFAPAVIGGHWENHWVFWVGPMLGGPIGAIAHFLPERMFASGDVELDASVEEGHLLSWDNPMTGSRRAVPPTGYESVRQNPTVGEVA